MSDDEEHTLLTKKEQFYLACVVRAYWRIPGGRMKEDFQFKPLAGEDYLERCTKRIAKAFDITEDDVLEAA